MTTLYRISSVREVVVFAFVVLIVSVMTMTPAEASAMTPPPFSSSSSSSSINNQPLALEGVELPSTVRDVNGTVLSINGAGVRVIRILGFPFNVYVAGLYTDTPLRSSDQALTMSGHPLQMVFTFLRTVSHAKVKEAWEKQLDASVTYNQYDGYEQDRMDFVEMFGPTWHGGTQMISFVGNTTLVYDQGVQQGVIEGEHFQKAFLSMWFGTKAVAPDLMEGLLGLSSSFSSSSSSSSSLSQEKDVPTTTTMMTP